MIWQLKEFIKVFNVRTGEREKYRPQEKLECKGRVQKCKPGKRPGRSNTRERGLETSDILVRETQRWTDTAEWLGQKRTKMCHCIVQWRGKLLLWWQQVLWSGWGQKENFNTLRNDHQENLFYYSLWGWRPWTCVMSQLRFERWVMSEKMTRMSVYHSEETWLYWREGNWMFALHLSMGETWGLF